MAIDSILNRAIQLITNCKQKKYTHTRKKTQILTKKRNFNNDAGVNRNFKVKQGKVKNVKACKI